MFLEALARDLERTQRAIPASCLFCVPQPRSLVADHALSPDELYTHFLTPAGAAGDARARRSGEYDTLNGKSVRIQGSHVVTGAGFGEPRKVRILLSEQREMQRQHVTVLHLSRPLAGGVALPEDPNEIDVATFRRVTAILRAFPENELAFYDLDETAAQARRICTHHQFFNRYEQTLPALLRDEWEAAVDAILRAGSFESDGEGEDDGGYGGGGAGRSNHLLQIQQVVECYLMEQLHAFIFPRVVVSCRSQDAALGRVLYRMRHYTHEDFGIRKEFQCSVQTAVSSLLDVRDRQTPLDMLLAFKSCIDSVNDAITRNLEQHSLDFGRYQMTTDDILDQLLFVLVQAFNQSRLLDAGILQSGGGDGSDDDDESDGQLNGVAAGRGSLSQNAAADEAERHADAQQPTTRLGESAAHFPIAAVLSYISDYHFINSNTTALGFTIANFQVAIEYFLLRAAHIESCRACLAHDGGDRTAVTATDGDATSPETSAAPCPEGILLSKCEAAHARNSLDLERWAANRAAVGGDGSAPRHDVRISSGDRVGAEPIDSDGGSRHLFVVGDWSSSEKREEEQEEIEEEQPAALASATRVTRVQTENIDASSTIVQVSAGQRFFAATNDQGQLFTWGDRSGGRLGYAAAAGDSRRVYAPRLVAALSKQHVASVACGAFHTLATDVNGHVFAWGSNTRGQLGFLTHSSAESPSVVAPTLVADLRGAYVSSVACGEYHSLALSSSGRVFSWGCNRYTKLGRAAETFAAAVQPKVLEGNWIGLALDMKTVLVEAGGGGVGASDASLQSVVRRIAAGKDHSVAITYAGAVFTWGRGDSGQLGHGDYMDVDRPRQVMALSPSGGDGPGAESSGVRVVDADGGSDFSLFLASTGAAFVSGRDPSRLQLPEQRPATSSRAVEGEDATWLFPQLIELSGVGRSGRSAAQHEPAAAVVTSVSCGEAHFALHLSTGSVLLSASSASSTSDSERGSEVGEDAGRSPRQLEHVSALQAAQRVACGGSHTLVLS